MTHAPKPDAVLCPYCGHSQRSGDRCESCKGLFEPLSRQATQNAMGPWQLRDESQPFRPGFSYETLRSMIQRGRIGADSVLRGPTTSQFWRRAIQTPGVSHLLGRCHACAEPAHPDDRVCPSCGESFSPGDNRSDLGLSPVRPLSLGAPAANGVAPGVRATSSPRGSRGSPTGPFDWDAPIPTRRTRRSAAHWAVSVGVVLAAGVLGVAAIAMALSERSKPVSASVAATPDAEPQVSLEPAAPPPQSPIEALATAESEPTPADRARSRWAAEFADAVRQGDTGGEEAVREAIARLRAIEADAPPEAYPAGLAAEIARLERRLDTLVLRKFL